MVRMSRRSPSTRRRVASTSTTVMSLASLASSAARLPPTCPAPRMMIFMDSSCYPRSALVQLDQSGQIETVMALWLGQQLATGGLGRALAHLDWQLPGTAVALQKGFDDSGVLLGQHRTGGIDQNAAYLEGLPQGIQQLALQGSQRGYVLGLAGQLDVRMTADHPGGGAGRVQQYALERSAIPPAGQLPPIGRLECSLQLQTLQILAHPLQSARLQIDRKSTRLNSSHVRISYAVFCLKKKSRG